MIVIQRRFSDVRIKHTEISPTLEQDGGGGDGNLPMVLIIYEDKQDKRNSDRDRPLQPGINERRVDDSQTSSGR